MTNKIMYAQPSMLPVLELVMVIAPDSVAIASKINAIMVI